MKLLDSYGIKFDENSLINVALTHTSYANEHNTVSYERLEFLGDAVLELLCSHYLYECTHFKEGEMSRMRSLYVCENALYEYSKKIRLKDYIRLGNSVKTPNKTIIADVFEAMMGVIYLEKGYPVCKKLFFELIVPYIESNVDFLNDYKTMFQEQMQTEQKTISYVVTNESGPAHKKTFEVDVIIDGIVYGHGIGGSKKEAEQNAAKKALSKHA